MSSARKKSKADRKRKGSKSPVKKQHNINLTDATGGSHTDELASKQP